jgi:MFS family permease
LRQLQSLGALGERPFRLLWLGQTTSRLGDALTGVALAFAVLDVGGSASALGVVLASFVGARAMFILVGGVWADRLPRRLVMLTCDGVRAVVQGTVAIALLTDAMEVWMFVVAATIAGAATAFFGPASTGLVPETISPARLQQANALLSFSQSATEVLGPALAGLLVAATSPGWVFAVDAASYAVSAVFLALLPLVPRELPARRRFLSDLADGMREAWSRGWMRAGFLLPAVGNLGIAPFVVLGPVVAKEELGGAGAIGGLVAGLVGLRFKPSRPILAAFALWTLGALPALALLPPAPALVIAVANGAFIFGVVLGNVLYETVVQREIPAERLSRVSSFDWAISIVVMPIGLALAGPVADAIGTDATLVAGAVLIVVSAGSGMAVPSVRALRASPVAGPG